MTLRFGLSFLEFEHRFLDALAFLPVTVYFHLGKVRDRAWLTLKAAVAYLMPLSGPVWDFYGLASAKNAASSLFEWLSYTSS